MLQDLLREHNFEHSFQHTINTLCYCSQDILYSGVLSGILVSGVCVILFVCVISVYILREVNIFRLSRRLENQQVFDRMGFQSFIFYKY